MLFFKKKIKASPARLRWLVLPLVCSLAHGAIINLQTAGAQPGDAALATCQHNAGVLNRTLAQLQPGDELVVPPGTFWLMGGVYASNLSDVAVRVDGTLAFSNDSKAMECKRRKKTRVKKKEMVWLFSFFSSSSSSFLDMLNFVVFLSFFFFFLSFFLLLLLLLLLYFVFLLYPKYTLKVWPRDAGGHVHECIKLEWLRNVTFTSTQQGTLFGNGRKWWGAVKVTQNKEKTR